MKKSRFSDEQIVKSLSPGVDFRIVVVNYAANIFMLGSFWPLRVTDFVCLQFLSSFDHRLGGASRAAV